MVWDHDVAGSNPVTPTTVILNIGGTDMKTRRTIEGTSRRKFTEEAYTLSNPPCARLLDSLLDASIFDGGIIKIPIQVPLDKIRVLFRIGGLAYREAVVVREFTLDNSTVGQELGLHCLNNVEFWTDVQLNMEWNGGDFRVEFVSGFNATNNDVHGDIILYEAC